MTTGNQTTMNATGHNETALIPRMETPLRLVVNNVNTEDQMRSAEQTVFIYDKPIFRAKKHDPF